MIFERDFTPPGDKPEVLLALGIRRRTRALFHDAKTRDEHEEANAKNRGLSFRDRYVRRDPLAIPGIEEVDTILLTPTGQHLHPGDEVKHFLVYFPATTLPDRPSERWPTMVWIDRIEGADRTERFVLTEDDGLQRVLDGGVPEVVTALPQATALNYGEVTSLAEEIKTFRLTPQAHSN